MDNYSQKTLHSMHGFVTQAENTIIVDSSSHVTEEQVKEFRCIIVFLEFTGQTITHFALCNSSKHWNENDSTVIN